MEKRKASPSVLSSIPKGSLPLQILSFVTIVMCLLVEELQKQVETLRGEKKKLFQENQKLKQACIHVLITNAMLILLFCIVM